MLETLPEGYSLFASHVHTPASDGRKDVFDIFSDLSQFRDTHNVNIIAAITDHDTFRGIRDAEKASAYFNVPMVIGEEITIGRIYNPKHMLAYWEEEPESPVPYGKCAEGTIDAIRASGGIVVPAHANAYKGIGSFTAKEIQELENRELIGGIETINGVADRGPGLMPTVTELRKDNPVALLAGSDSHFAGLDLFRALTKFKGKSVHDLFDAIRIGETTPLLLNEMDFKIGLGEKIKQNWKANVQLNNDRYIRKNLQPRLEPIKSTF